MSLTPQKALVSRHIVQRGFEGAIFFAVTAQWNIYKQDTDFVVA